MSMVEKFGRVDHFYSIQYYTYVPYIPIYDAKKGNEKNIRNFEDSFSSRDDDGSGGGKLN